jgi:hypothetical protein
VHLEAVLAEKIGKDAWMLDGGMLQDDEVQRSPMCHRSRSPMRRRPKPKRQPMLVRNWVKPITAFAAC